MIANASIKKGKRSLSMKMLCVLLLFITASFVLWSFNEVVQWQWLTDHPNKLVIYIAFQANLLFIMLWILFRNKEARMMELLTILISIASMVIPLLTGSPGKTNTIPHPGLDTIVEFTPPYPIDTSAQSPVGKKDASRTNKSRIVYLSGIVVDAANAMPLDSVAIIINYFIVGYSDRFGNFNIQYIPDRYTETTTLQFQKQGYQKAMETTLTPVKDADIELTGKKIELFKV